MNKLKIISLTAGMVLALAFTFSCSSDGGSGSGSSTYWYSAYGVTDPYACTELDELRQNPSQNGQDYDPTFDEVKEIWLEMRASGAGKTIWSREISETELRNEFLEAGYTPSETNEFINELNKRGNNMLMAFGNSQYCYTFGYFEKM